MPFPPGYKSPGRPKRGERLYDLLRSVSNDDKRKLVKKAYQLAINGDVRAMEWISRTAGEGPPPGNSALEGMPEGSTIREIIIRETHIAAAQLREDDAEYAGNVPLEHATDTPALPDGDIIEGETVSRSETPDDA